MPELTAVRSPAPAGAGVPSFAQCRAAARSIQRAECGRETVDLVRPRGVFGVFRSRGPLAVLLYVAARDGRLVWRGIDSLALLTPPADRPRRTPGRGPALALLRIVERRWEMLLFDVPPFVLMGAALLVIALRHLIGPAALLTGLLLLLLALVHICVLMTCLMVNGLVWAARTLGRAQPSDDRIAAEVLPDRYWSMTLCHQSDHSRADELLRHTLRHLAGLITADLRRAATDLGAEVPVVNVTETLVCLRRGVTTERMRAAVAAWSGQPRLFAEGAEVTMRMSAQAPRRRALRLFESGGFLFWYIGGVASLVALEAVFVADWERDGCAAADCAGRPTTYPLALRWLAQRLLLTDPLDLRPGTFQAWSIGWLTSLMSLTGLVVTMAAVQQFRAYRQDKVAAFERALGQMREEATVLIMVASAVERDAVRDAVRDVTGVEPEPTFLPHHTVWRLGAIGNARLLLVQSEQGAVGPGAAAITAASLIMRLDPDYLVLTGICFGLREDRQRLGDVLVCTQLRALDHRYVGPLDHRYVGLPDHPYAGLPDGAEEPTQTLVLSDYVAPSQTLLDRFRGAQMNWHTAKVHFGQMLSASVLVNSPELRAELLRQQPDALGGEMEGAGVYAAAAPGKVDWIVVKGISDWGQHRAADNADNRELAARNAAAFVVHTVGTGALDDRPVRGVI